MSSKIIRKVAASSSVAAQLVTGWSLGGPCTASSAPAGNSPVVAAKNGTVPINICDFVWFC